MSGDAVLSGPPVGDAFTAHTCPDGVFRAFREDEEEAHYNEHHPGELIVSGMDFMRGVGLDIRWQTPEAPGATVEGVITAASQRLVALQEEDHANDRELAIWYLNMALAVLER